jgi:hypothetical protein
MKSKVEFHCHTSNSFDCDVLLSERIKSYASLGFTHLTITDHDEVLNKQDLTVISSYDRFMQVIPGIEISTHVGHIILLNCKKKPWFNSLFFLVIWSKLSRSQIYIPHPFRKGTGLLIEYVVNKLPTWYILWFLKHVKYVEIWNPRDTLKDKVKVDYSICKMLENKLWTIASDSHFINDIHIEGCPFEGLSSNDPLVIRFFNQNMELAKVDIALTLRAALRYFKSALRYALKQL